MKSRKKLIVISIMLVVFVVLALVIYLNVKPYLHATKVIKRLWSENYTYDIECYIEGVTIMEGDYGSITVFMEGEKYKQSMRGYVYSEREAYLEVFANTDKDVVFNIRPTCEFVSNKLEEVLNISVGDLVVDMEDTYVTLEEIESVLELDVVSMDDYEINSKKDKKTGKYSIKKTDEPSRIKVDYDEDSEFFELVLEDYDVEIIIGVPKDLEEETVYVRISKDDTKVEMCMEYEVSDVEKIEFPESSFDEEDIEKFKKVYKMWVVGKAAYDKIFGTED